MSTTTKVAAAVAAMLLALTGCTADEPEESDAGPTPTETASSPGPATAPAPPRPPAVGACYRLTLAEATAPTSEADPVPCRKAHTAQTIHVGTLDTVVDGHEVAVDSTRVQRQLARTCPARLTRFVGGTPETRRLSRLEVVWFSPTLEQADAGASWFRCDVLAFGDGDDLLPLPRQGTLRGVLDRPDALATYGVCGTARPGAPGFTRVACALRHSWVAIGTIPIAGGERYPGVPAVRGSGNDACADLVRDRAGFPLEFSYGWEWPTRRQWAAGQRYGFCWAPNDLA